MRETSQRITKTTMTSQYYLITVLFVLSESLLLVWTLFVTQQYGNCSKKEGKKDNNCEEEEEEEE